MIAIVVANSRFPAGNLKELMAYAKANPGRINWALKSKGGRPGNWALSSRPRWIVVCRA